jgi:hydrogenase-4 component A
MVSDGTPPTSDGGSPTRRDVLKGATVAVGAFIAFEAIGGVSLAAGGSPKPTPVSNGVIAPDPTLCIGCLTCEVICSQVHKQQGLSDLPRIRIYDNPATRVDPEVQNAYPGRGSFHQEPCLQCPTAECLYVCPVNAVRVEPTTGARIIKEDVCVACNRCAEACIFPTSAEEHATNRLKYGQESRISYDPVRDNFTKCDLCYWREGGPACVDRCPVNVRIRQGVLKVEAGRMCLDLPKVNDKPTWDKLRAEQTFTGAPAQASKA